MTLTSTSRAITVGVDSEIGALCEVIVHRPGRRRLAPGDTPGALAVRESRGLPAAPARALDGGPVRMLIAGAGDGRAPREPWDDADNYLAVAPGVVVGYARNVVTNRMLRRNGIDVITLDGSELGRGRGGARSMSCPVHRHPLRATGALW